MFFQKKTKQSINTDSWENFKYSFTEVFCGFLSKTKEISGENRKNRPFLISYQRVYMSDIVDEQ